MNDITVLVVDDESRMRKLIKDFLKQILPNYKITSFTQIQQDKKRNVSF